MTATLARHQPVPDRVSLRVSRRPDRRAACVEIVVPVYNEAASLDGSIRRLHRYLSDRFPLSWLVTIADNASTDGTWAIASALAGELDGVDAVHLPAKGRGRALKAVWRDSHAQVVAYTDVDLSTDLDALLPLVAPLVSGHSDVSIGTRLAAGANVTRGPRREAISRSYNLILRTTLRSGFSDAQCGFKAVRTDVAKALLPAIVDDGWFFDTELLALAEHNGLRIHEVPVDWVDDPDSRVDVVSTAKDDLAGVWRLLNSFARGGGRLDVGARSAVVDADEAGQLVRFAWVGAASTLLFAALYVALRRLVGPLTADLGALTLSAVANTAAHRRITFALRGRAGRTRHWLSGLATAAVPVVTTSVALGLLAVAGPGGLVAELVVLTAANALATLVRFGLLRHWVFS